MKILFFDIDGTIAHGFMVPDSTQHAMIQAMANGHLVFICTGRPINYVKEHFGHYANGYICFNGRYGELNGEVLYDCPLDKEQVREIEERLNQLKAGYFFYNNVTSYQGGYLHDSYIPLAIGDDVAYNFNVFFEGKEHYKKIEESISDICILNPHGDMPHADATILGSDKGDAIKAIVRKLNIPFEDTYAFGDGLNDVSMMKAVCHSVAMGNAFDEVKSISEYVTTDYLEDGIENGLKHYGLI